MSKLYSLNLLRFGAEIFGLDLKKSLSNDIISQIKKDVTKYRLVIFRNLGQVSGDRHVEIAEWFGKLTMSPLQSTLCLQMLMCSGYPMTHSKAALV